MMPDQEDGPVLVESVLSPCQELVSSSRESADVHILPALIVEAKNSLNIASIFHDQVITIGRNHGAGGQVRTIVSMVSWIDDSWFEDEKNLKPVFKTRFWNTSFK